MFAQVAYADLLFLFPLTTVFASFLQSFALVFVHIATVCVQYVKVLIMSIAIYCLTYLVRCLYVDSLQTTAIINIQLGQKSGSFRVL